MQRSLELADLGCTGLGRVGELLPRVQGFGMGKTVVVGEDGCEFGGGFELAEGELVFIGELGLSSIRQRIIGIEGCILPQDAKQFDRKVASILAE